jgi:hypothetical protein
MEWVTDNNRRHSLHSNVSAILETNNDTLFHHPDQRRHNDLPTRLMPTAEQSAILIITNEYRLGKSSNTTGSCRALDTA